MGTNHEAGTTRERGTRGTNPGRGKRQHRLTGTGGDANPSKLVRGTKSSPLLRTIVFFVSCVSILGSTRREFLLRLHTVQLLCMTSSKPLD